MSRSRKIPLYIFLFFLLFFSNIYFTVKLVKKQAKQQAISRILAEITDEKKEEKILGESSGRVETNYLYEVQLADGRIANLKAFFRKHGSPLYDFAPLIVQQSDINGFDYRLLAAIAMQESNLCRNIPQDSFNCWGWGIYGDKVTKFSSYEEAIITVAAGIKKEYIGRGLVTASAIMAKYTPSSNGSWAKGVNTFLRLLE